MSDRPRYEIYQDGPTRRKVGRKWVEDKRCWAVYENDGSEDGRLIGNNMLHEDAERIAALLNQAEMREAGA